jgi:hypothetical protein
MLCQNSLEFVESAEIPGGSSTQILGCTDATSNRETASVELVMFCEIDCFLHCHGEKQSRPKMTLLQFFSLAFVDYFPQEQFKTFSGPVRIGIPSAAAAAKGTPHHRRWLFLKDLMRARRGSDFKTLKS